MDGQEGGLIVGGKDELRGGEGAGGSGGGYPHYVVLGSYSSLLYSVAAHA